MDRSAAARTLAGIAPVREGTFAQATLEEGAAALNRVFEDYFLPITFSAEQLRLHMTYYDVEAALLADLVRRTRRRGCRVAAGGSRDSRMGRRFRRCPCVSRPRLRANAHRAHDRVGSRDAACAASRWKFCIRTRPQLPCISKVGFKMTRRLVSFETLTEHAAMPGGFFSIAPRTPDRGRRACVRVLAARTCQPAQRRRNRRRHGRKRKLRPVPLEFEPRTSP